MMNPIELSIFSSRLTAICDEMGAVLRNAAFSPNIRDRLDFSCAVFDAAGELCAQAAHIPVHLGSMAYAMRDIVQGLEWRSGDMVILNDPFLGGTHLPDVTLIAPVILDDDLAGFVVNRAHHADIGAATPGSMPLSTRLDEEGLVIEPTYIHREDLPQDQVFRRLQENARDPEESRGDIAAQISANQTGARRLSGLIRELGPEAYERGLSALNDYGEVMAREALRDIPPGNYAFEDWMESDGQGAENLPIRVAIEVRPEAIRVDFTGTAPQTGGNINCPLSVAAAAVFYVFRCLMPAHTPACAGVFRPIRLHAPAGCLLNARPPAAVAAGNVETSQRVVDAVCGALAQALPERIPAASQGTMNNLAMGADGYGRQWDYYETIGGGIGAGPAGPGLSAVQSHMTNTLNTPIEVLETRFPLRITRYMIRRGSGGEGRFRGGDGLIREFLFLAPSQVTLLTERRTLSPWGLAGGAPGAPGVNLHNDRPVAAKAAIRMKAGDCLELRTPGGGGWGAAQG